MSANVESMFYAGREKPWHGLGTAYGTFTWNGTNGLPVSFEADIPLFSKYTNLRLFFAQGGLKMHLQRNMDFH